jgi:hypothetical protein
MCPKCSGEIDMMSGICRPCGYDVTKPPGEQGRGWKGLLFGLPVLVFVVWLSRDDPAMVVVSGGMFAMAIIRYVATGDTNPRT